MTNPFATALLNVPDRDEALLDQLGQDGYDIAGVAVWDPSVRPVIRAVCGEVNRTLTESQWHTDTPGRSYRPVCPASRRPA